MKHFLFIVGLLAISKTLCAQQPVPKITLYHNYWSEEVFKTDEEVASRIERYTLATQTRLDSVFSFTTGRLQFVESTTYGSDGDTLITIIKWRTNGKLLYSCDSKGYRKPQTQLFYNKDGTLIRRVISDAGKDISTHCYDASGAIIACTEFAYVECMPMFPGGNYGVVSCIAQNIVYPAKALKKRRQGVIHLQFVVDPTGQVRNVRVKESLSPELDAAAVRAGKALPRFAPGTQNEEPVPVSFTVPVTFKIN